LQHEDGDKIAEVSAQIEAGRPPGIPQGSDFRSVLAISAEIQFPKTGGYELRADLDGEQRTSVFRVHAPAPFGGMAPPPPPLGPSRY
jgi:hypothetical protein